MNRKDLEDHESECDGVSTAFLLAQVGAHAASAFAERLAALGLNPPHAGVVRMIAMSEGLSQRALAKTLGILPSRLVTLVDELEARGLVVRRDDPNDRRTHALHLTESGRAALDQIGRIAREHDEAITESLSPDEKRLLADLLTKIAGREGLSAGVHPGYRNMGRGSDENDDTARKGDEPA